MKKISIFLFFLSIVSSIFAVDSLHVQGRAMLDGYGLKGVDIGSVSTNGSGYFSFVIPAGKDTSFAPELNHFLFEPAIINISSQDTVLDSIDIFASRQAKKVIVIAGQSNAGFHGTSEYFIPDNVDQHIPYYMAYNGVEHGLDVLGLMSNFGVYSWSNFGIEIQLARTLFKHYTDSLAVMKIGWGGTSLITNWDEYGDARLWFNDMHKNGVDSLHAEGYEPEFIGFFWYQGESDRSSHNSAIYGDSLYHLVDRMRECFPNSSEVDSLPFVCVRIIWNREAIYEEPVRQAQMNIVNNRSHTAWVDVDDLYSYRVSDTNLHFNGIALNRIGYKLATTYLDLVGHPIDSSVSVNLNFNGNIDPSMRFFVGGTRALIGNINSPTYTFPAKLGDSLNIRPVPADEYEFAPPEITIPFVYDPAVILDDAYTFEIKNILNIRGRVMLDSSGLAGVQIGSAVTDSDGYYSFELPAGFDTSFVPVYKNYVFDPEEIIITAQDTHLDSVNFTAKRQVKKVIVISGQSNAENMGEPQKYFISDTVDNQIPYYLAYCYGDFGYSTLGLLTKFGYSYDYCKGYDKGFGLEMLLARTLYKNYTDSLAVIKAPYSGTSLYQDWKPEGDTWKWFVEKHENAVEAFHEDGYELEYIGFFWFQGESDETAMASSRYPGNLRRFIDSIRERFPNSSEVDSLPFICVQINWNPDSPYEAPVRAAQMDIPNWRGYARCIDIDDCDYYRYSNQNMHFNGDALNRIGYRLAVEYLDMVGSPIDSNITVSIDLDEAIDTTVILTVEGDTSFTHVMDSLTFDFPAKAGDSLGMYLNLNSEVYTSAPALRRILFAYDQSALYDETYTYNVNKIVAIEEYPDEMDHVLMDCYPNPFNPTTAINFQLPEHGDVKLCIFNISGKKIATLVDMPMESGAYEVKWNAGACASGMYVARLQVGSETVTQKLVLMK